MGKALHHFGPFVLDSDARTLRRDEAIVHLTPKEFDTLQCLVENSGQVVSKKTLMESVWPNQPFLDESNLAHHIKALRRKLGEEGSSYVKTAVGEGYYLSVPMTVVHKSQGPPTDSIGAKLPLSAPGHLFSWGAVVVAVIAILAAGAVLNSERVRGSEPRVAGYRQLSHDGLPKAGRLLTDGRLVYFSEYVNHEMNSDQRLAAVTVVGGDVVYPATPNPPSVLLDIKMQTGDRLLARGKPVDPGPILFWKSHANSAEPVGSPVAEASLSPDGTLLTYCDGRHNLIIQGLSPKPSVKKIPLSGNSGAERWSPDGAKIRFGVFDEAALLPSMWEVRRDGSGLRQLPIVGGHGRHLRSEGWTSDGRYFIFSEFGGYQQGANLEVISEAQLNHRDPRPFRLSAPIDFGSVAIAPDNSTVFAIGATSRNELVKFDLQKKVFLPVWNALPAIDVSFSNDKTASAFVRYPEFTLWVSKADGSDRRQITQSNIEAHQPHWSPDGHRIAFMGQVHGKLWRAYVVNASGGVPQEVNPNDPFDQGVPSWSSDGRSLVFGELRERKPDAEMVIRVFDLQSRAEKVLPGSSGKWSPRWSPDGRFILALTSDFKELDLFNCESQTWTALARGLRMDDASWSPNGEFIHFSAATNRGKGLFRIRIANKVVEQLALQPEEDYPWSGVALDGAPLTMRSVRIEEIYALSLKLP